MNDERSCSLCGSVYSNFEYLVAHLRMDHAAYRLSNELRVQEAVINQQVSDFGKMLERLDAGWTFGA